MSAPPPGSYELIVADPPWRYQMRSPKGYGKSPQQHYACMGAEDIKAMAPTFSAAPDCLLILWAVWPMLPLALEVMSAWGFEYKTGGHWHKMTKHGKQHFGTGFIVRGASEPFLIGTIGAPKTSRSCRNAIAAPPPLLADEPAARMEAAALVDMVREHSRKPDAFYEWCEKLMPGAARLEMFARQRRPGWDAWGDETYRFEEEKT